MPPLTAPKRASFVLDTNAVLDWMVFGDPHGAAVGCAVETSRVVWVATPEMRDEYFHVIGRQSFRRWSIDATEQIRLWDQHCSAESASDRIRDMPRYTDPDDQMFVDLAVASRSTWLLSHDKALLVMAPRLRELGVEVTTPARWASGPGGATGAG